MNYLNPIYTEKRECQDCYKCVRHCPVKAIKVQGGVATVLVDSCTLCGNCVAVCPNGAKRVRDDLPRARQLVASGRKVVASLAPSYVAAFPNLRPEQMIAALQRLGFWNVSETALGAQQVSAHVARLLHEQPGRAMISSACPTIVTYLQRHRPEQAGLLTPLLSPLLAHCKILRETYGREIGTVFLGPCIAKKWEADAHPDLLDVALTFNDLRQWFEQERIDPYQFPADGPQRFVPETATDGALYPVDGGMIAGIKADCRINDCALMAFSGLGSVQKAIDGLEHFKPEQSLLLELLACEGGCVNGPVLGGNGQTTVERRYNVLRNASYDGAAIPRPPGSDIGLDLNPAPVAPPQYSERQIRDVLHDVGKFSTADELNCGGCGYDYCREFAKAMLSGKAERSMCVTYMRQLAHKKANALIQKMPAAAVIVDQALRVLECNDAFVRMFVNGHGGGDAATPANAGLTNVDLATLVPFHKLFASVVRTGEDIVDKDLRFRDTILHLSVFTIEKHCIVGAVIQDMTRPAVQKEQVIRKAREVIQRNLATVQQIACLLGENAAESEITLNSIIESFSPALGGERPDDAAGGGAAGAAAKPPEPEGPGGDIGNGGASNRGDPHDWRQRYRH